MTQRIAYLCGQYPRATDTFIQREVAGLRRSGFDVLTISVRRPAREEQGTEEQKAERERTRYLLPCGPLRLLAVHAALLSRSPARYGSALWTALTVRAPGLRSLAYQLFYFAEAGLVAALLRRHGIGHLHNHTPDAGGYVTMLAAQLGGTTYSLTLHGYGIFSEPRRWRLTEKLGRALFTVCISEHGRSQAMHWSPPEHWRKLHVVHCGVDPDQYTPREHAGPGQQLLFVGRMDPVKGLPVLLDAFADLARRHPDLQLRIVGDGPERARVEAIIRDKGIAGRVELPGYLSSAALRDEYAAADVVVMSSFFEGIPVVLMEAMASAVPIVAPRITGIPELVADGASGFLFTPGNAEEMADRVDQLLRDPGLRGRFGAEGARIVRERFNLDHEVSGLAQIMTAHLGAAEPSAARPVPRPGTDTDGPAAAPRPAAAGHGSP